MEDGRIRQGRIHLVAVPRIPARDRTTKIRMVITKDNDGWHGDRKWMYVLMGKTPNYTASKTMISELEAYGSAAAADGFSQRGDAAQVAGVSRTRPSP